MRRRDVIGVVAGAAAWPFAAAAQPSSRARVIGLMMLNA
jgi:hypothetical protein